MSFFFSATDSSARQWSCTSRKRLSLRWFASVLCVVLAFPAFARGPVPALRIPLEPLGYTNISTRYLLEGATMMTVDYVDKDHLLVTFGISKLMKRLPDCPSDDQDRVVRAVLLELPSGKELAHVEWRFHDLGQYLWNLGGGMFLLRQRDELTSFTPLDDVAHGRPIELHSFLHFDRRIDAVVVSANHELLSIETTKRKKPEPDPDPLTLAGTVSQAASPTAPHSLSLQHRVPQEVRPDTLPVEISFVALDHHRSAATGGGPGRDVVVARLAGRIHTSKPVSIPLTTEGFLETNSTTRDGVLFNFLTYTGKSMDLGDFPTSCSPKPSFVSSSEFVAFGCRGSEDSTDLAGFNLRGDFLWQMNFTDLYAYPSIASAVSAGRFALSRTLTLSNIFGSETPSSSQLSGQEVRVVQMYNGKQLLRVPASPIQRAGQNFAMSPDGLNLAVIHDNPTIHGEETVHDTAVEIYSLPPLTSKDQKEIDAETALAPPHADAAMHFSIAEIKAALTRKPEVTAEDVSGHNEEHPDAKEDARIVGDPPPSDTAAQNATGSGSISGSDPAPACAGLADQNARACPVNSESKPSTQPAEITPDQPRKPPTLYQPGEKPEHPPTASPQ